MVSARVFWVVADPTTHFQVLIAVTELKAEAPVMAPMESPLIGPNEMVPEVTEAAFQVPPVLVIFPTLSVQSVV